MSPPNLDTLSAEDKLDLITEAITIEPRNWTKAHMQVLPKHFLLKSISTFTLRKIWDDLPELIRNDEEVQSHLPCFEHYNRPEDTIHIDGPPPSKLRCRGCIREKKLKEDNRKRESDSSNSGSGFKDDNRTGIFTSS